MPLVNSLQAKEVGRNSSSSSRAFGHPSERRGIVSESMDGALTAVNVVDEHVVLRNSAGEFKIRVGDRTTGVLNSQNSYLLEIFFSLFFKTI